MDPRWENYGSHQRMECTGQRNSRQLDMSDIVINTRMESKQSLNTHIYVTVFGEYFVEVAHKFQELGAC